MMVSAVKLRIWITIEKGTLLDEEKESADGESPQTVK